MSTVPDHEAVDLPLVLETVDLSSVLGAAFREVVTDGLPVVPPTRASIAAMLGGRRADEIVAALPPILGECRLDVLGALAVLAGCRPRVFPALIAAIRAAAHDAFNLLAAATTTGNVALAMLVSGPRVAELGLHAGGNAIGPGPQGNVTLGRALRLAVMNIGGATPGVLDIACLGWPGKLSFCAAEHAAANPWPPFHASRGFAAEATVVTLAAAYGFIEMADATSAEAEPLLSNLTRMLAPARSSASRGSEVLVFLTPQHAHICAQAGLSREAVQARLHEHLLDLDGHIDGATGKVVRAVSRPEDVLLFVMGGTGGKSALVPLWGGSRTVSVAV